MKKTIIIFGIIIGLMSCTQTKYFIKSEKDLSHIDWEQSIINYIPITNIELEQSPVLDTTYNLIVLKKYSILINYLSSVQTKTPDYYLANTLYYISICEYQEALVNLKMITKNHHELIKELLSVDLNYEIEKINGSINYKKFLNDYQVLIDKYPDNENLKKIIALRTRYIRYNY